MTEVRLAYKIDATVPPPPENFPAGWMAQFAKPAQDDRELPELWDLGGSIPEFTTSRATTKNQPVAFFVSKRPQKLDLPYPRMIAGYCDDPANYYPASYLDECFTPDELAAFTGWMEEHYPDIELKPEKIEYPISSNIMGVGANPVGGPTDFMMLNRHDAYDLPFDVWFYYDLRYAEEAANGKPAQDGGQEKQYFKAVFEYNAKDLVTWVIDESVTVQDLIETCREWTDYYADDLTMINVRFVEISSEEFEQREPENNELEGIKLEKLSNYEEMLQAFISVYGRGLSVPFFDWFDSLRPGQKRRVNDDFKDFAVYVAMVAKDEKRKEELMKLAEFGHCPFTATLSQNQFTATF